MQEQAKVDVCGRARRRLERARENGYLDATGAKSQGIAEAHGLWCWRLRLPKVWFERCSPYSKYGRVHLDLFSTSHVLTDRGQAALENIGARLEIDSPLTMSLHDARWNRVPLRKLDALAKSVLKTTLKAGNCELNRSEVRGDAKRKSATLVNISDLRAAASA